MPVWMPTRTRIGPERRASVIARAAASAPGAVGKATKKASPWVSTSTPPFAVQAARMSRRCSARAAAYPSLPSSCRSLVEPSTSVNRKVTVPDGSFWGIAVMMRQRHGPERACQRARRSRIPSAPHRPFDPLDSDACAG